MKKLSRFLFGHEKGITLLELVVVLSILAVVASIVTPAVGGQTTRGRASTKASDIAAVQSAVDNFSSDSPSNSDLSSGYPVNGKQKPSNTTGNYHAVISDFKLPDGSTTTLYVKPIDFNSEFTASGEAGTTTKKLVPNYVRAFPKHSGTTTGGGDPNIKLNVSEQNTDGTVVFTGGNVTFPTGSNDYTPGGTIGTSAPTNVGVWVIDQDGRVWILLDDGYY